MTPQTVCAASVERLGVTGTSVAVGSGAIQGELLYSTDEVSRQLQDLHFMLGEGPVVDAVRGGLPVFAPDLSATASGAAWPLFAGAAIELGALAMFVLPLRIGAIQPAIFSLYRDAAGSLSPEQMADAAVFADIALQLILDTRGGVSAGGSLRQKHAEPMGRAEVHQATGMVSVQLGVDMEQSLVRLRAYAFANQLPLADVVRDVVARRLRFDADNVDNPDDDPRTA
ncbi:ANTAR domain-containing protein [Solihabitans fulvus]|uniref:ANTAR domain-containing protein n=1 Tax=Solihabitans fulvus TaxID=1892852 RepID=A0A5B2XPP2_9PSEU|nr:ANTAR domain-containing protein [Solihabitans fulvus]KAA2264914.1 ANTAR domain-containing protein [Solihabitans fulvus]